MYFLSTPCYSFYWYKEASQFILQKIEKAEEFAPETYLVTVVVEY